MSLLKRDFAKPMIAAISLILVITIATAYLLPEYVYISPFSAVYINGIVNHKVLGHFTDDKGFHNIYQISVTPLEDDPVNNEKSGFTRGYVFSESDWNLVEWGDTIKMRVYPNAKGEIVNLYPASEPSSGRQSIQLEGLTIKLNADKQNYSPYETVNLTLSFHNENQSLPSIEHKSLSIFKVFTFWVYDSAGNRVYSSSSNVSSETQEVPLIANQTVNFNFQWSINNLPAGYYTVRVYAGYFTGDEDGSLTGTKTIQIN